MPVARYSMKFTTLLSLPYHCLLYIYDYVLHTWPVTFLHSYTTTEVSEETSSAIQNIIDLLHCYPQDPSPQKTLEICQQIEQLNFNEHILGIQNNDLNLLQYAVISNCTEAVELVLQRCRYVPRNTCNSATHLAAMLGHEDLMVNLVKKQPAELYRSSGLCYPGNHEPFSHSRRLGLVFQDKFHCQQDLLLPLEWAISGDHLSCVKKLIFLMNPSKNKTNFDFPRFLHFAACKGAKRCLEYFVKFCPEEINNVNSNGDVPLLEAVVWGRECIQVLIDNGAEVDRVALNGDTALHRLYRNDIDGIFAIFETTRYLLTTGIEQLVNSINHHGETALHLLMTHVSYIGGNYYHEHRQKPRGSMQSDYQKQVIQTIELLLSFNADPHIFDSLHFQPLNKLLHVTMKASHPHDPLECVQNSINSKYIYRNDFCSLNKAIKILIKHGADVNTQCTIGHTPVILLLQSIIRTEVSDLIDQADDIISAFKEILQNGAKCNFLSEDQRTSCSLLAELAKKGFMRGTARDSDFRRAYGDFVNEILMIFLKYGLNPNYITTKNAGGHGNGLVEFVRLSVHGTNEVAFEMIHQWLKTLLQWGADPDIEPYPSDSIICHSQSSIFLKKQGTQALNHYINEVKQVQAILTKGHAEELLLLFYKTMDHKILFECLTNACFMARVQPLGPSGQHFLAVLNSLGDKPRSLKQMARVSIYKSLHRKIMTDVDLLPLPKAMKNYLKDIE